MMINIDSASLFLLLSQQQDLTRAEEDNRLLSNSNADLVVDLADLKRQLAESQRLIVDLQSKLPASPETQLQRLREAIKCIQGGAEKKIHAIKAVRELTNCGLGEAKEFVEEYPGMVRSI